VKEPARPEEVDIGERAEEEEPLDARREADEVEQELPPLGPGLEALEALDRIDPPETERRLRSYRRDVLDRGEGARALRGVRDVRVEEREVELHVQRLLVELTRQVHPRLGGVDVLVEIEDEVVRDDGVAGGEERDQPVDQVAFGVGHLLLEVADVGGEVDLFDGPGVLDGVAVHLVKPRVRHRPQGQAEAGVEQAQGTIHGAHWQASQVSGFSSEQATAAASFTAGGGGVQPLDACGSPAGSEGAGATLSTVALVMRVAGLERR
jgi:hypothetical protein